MEATSVDGRRALIEESRDSAEFFLSGVKTRISQLQSKRDALRSRLNTLESEERSLKVRQNKLKGISISQELRHRQERDVIESSFKASEELMWASKLEKEDKCRRLEVEVESLKRKRGLVNRPSLS